MANGDNWAHRSTGMRCKTCMWWVPKGDCHIGRCRRHAPTMSGFPVVYDDDWCGDHKLDGAAINQEFAEVENGQVTATEIRNRLDERTRADARTSGEISGSEAWADAFAAEVEYKDRCNLSHPRFPQAERMWLLRRCTTSFLKEGVCCDAYPQNDRHMMRQILSEREVDLARKAQVLWPTAAMKRDTGDAGTPAG